MTLLSKDTDPAIMKAEQESYEAGLEDRFRKVRQTLNAYQHAAAEFAGFNNCIDEPRRAEALLHFQQTFRDLQYKYVEKGRRTPGMCIMFHGTSRENAQAIKEQGFQAGTYFAHHLEDALHMGGDHIFEVVFEQEPTKYWEYICREPVPVSRIQCWYQLTPEVLWENPEAQLLVKKLLIKQEHGDEMVVCTHCEGRGQMEKYPLFTQWRDRPTCTACPVCNGHGKVEASGG